MNGDAREVLGRMAEGWRPEGLSNQEVDMVFIDADKPGYRHYLDWAMKHVRVGGVRR